MADIYIDQRDLQRAFKDLDRVAKAMRAPEWRKQTMRNAAQYVAVAAQKQQEVYKGGPHYLYQGNRRAKKRRKRGTALESRVKILPGNLRKSIQYLEKLKRTPLAVIGPNIKPEPLKVKNLGRSPKNTSGYYAWMAKKIYRGAEDFRRDIMEPALAETAPRIIKYAERKTAQNLEKVKKQLSIFG